MTPFPHLAVVMHGLVKSGASSRVANRCFSPLCQQLFYHLPVSIHARPMQGGVALGVGDVRVLHREVDTKQGGYV